MLFGVCRSPFTVRPRTTYQAFRPLRSANSLDQPRQHLLDVRSRPFQCFGLSWSKKSQILRQQHKTNQFIGRASGDVQELSEFGTGRSSTSLGNIGGDGSRSSSHLADQAKSFGIGIGSRRAIDTQGQSLTALPHFKLPEVLHLLTLFRIPCITPEGARLAHEYRTKQVSRSLIALTANDKRQTVNPSGELLC